MNRKFVVFVFGLLILISYPLVGQSQNSYKQMIQTEVKFIMQNLINPHTQKVSTDLLMNRSQSLKLISAAIKDNDLDTAYVIFDLYIEVLDTLAMSSPLIAKEIVSKLKLTYSNAPAIQSKIMYYSGLSNYYSGYYSFAENDLLSITNSEIQSDLFSKSLTILLKIFLITGNENKALSLIKGKQLNDEQLFYVGHLYYALEQDSLAVLAFSKITEPKYKKDTEKMLSLIHFLKEEPNVALMRFLELSKSDTSDPFVVLAIARLSSIIGNWADSEKYYRQYLSSIKQYWELQSQYELFYTLLNQGDRNRAIELLKMAIDKPEFSEYFTLLLLLYSELVTKNGKIEDARNLSSQLNSYLFNNESLLADKITTMNLVNDIKKSINTNHSFRTIRNTIVDVERIAVKLDSIHIKISQKPYGLSRIKLDNWYLQEKIIISSLLEQLRFYLIADDLSEVQDTLHINQLTKLESIYNEQIDQITKIKESLIKLNNENVYLAIRNEIDNNIDVLDRLLNKLYDMKKTGTSRYSTTQLDSLIAYNERKKVETALLIDYYDFDNSLYKEILEECNIATKSTIDILKRIPTLKKEFQEKYPAYLSKKEKSDIIKTITKMNVLIPEYLDSVTDSRKKHEKSKTLMDFISLYSSFIETLYYDDVKREQEKTLTFEESQRMFRENQARKQTLYNQIQSFSINYNRLSSSNKLNKDSEINIPAFASFALAELGNALSQDKPTIALNHYRKVLEYDPEFYLTDVVLYNIGFLSTAVTKDRIEKGITRFEDRYSQSINKPDSLRYSESTYKEPIEAYKRIISEFPNSVYYSESLFRLGYLYFEIGTNADRPVEYYQIARGYYDVIINKKNDPYRYKALYQRGWTWLNGSTEEAYKNAMNDFATILQAIDQKVISDSTEIIDFAFASQKNVGYCLISLDGADITSESKGAQFAQSSLINAVNKTNQIQIIDEAINQKLKLSMPMQAIDFMRVKINLNPLALENPIIADSICSLYRVYPNELRSGLSPDSIYIAERERIINQFGLNSQWYNANKDNNIQRQINIIKQSYYDIEIRYNNAFIDNPNEINLNKYSNLIIDYISFNAVKDDKDTKWIEEKQANLIAMNLKLAQTIKNPGYYLSAASKIYSFNDKYPENGYYFNLEGTAYDCANILYESFINEVKALINNDDRIKYPLSSTDFDSYYDAAVQRFISVLLSEKFRSPKNDELYIRVVMRQGEIFRSLKRYPKSMVYYGKVISFDGLVSNELKRTTYINMAEISDSTDNYIAAEEYYKKAGEFATSISDKEILYQYALLQIQNSIDTAKTKGNNSLAGEEYLRLANEYKNKDVTKSLQYKAQAQVSFQEAKDYKRSIALLLEIAQSKTNPKEVLQLYQIAWVIADSINAKSTSDSLKYAFVEKYPTTNEAYQLRLSIIDTKVNNPSTIREAADLYLVLYNDVINKKINPGNENPIELYLAAIGLYAQLGDETKKETLAEDFIGKYPNHSSAITLMEYLADRQLAKGDTLKYEQMSKTVFQKDKTSNSRYTNIAKGKLRQIYSEFSKAYVDKNWQLSFSKRDEFKNTHTSYEKEGLALEFTPVYELFKKAEKEYQEIQDKIAFQNLFNNQLNTIASGFLNKKADDLLRVNVNTQWKKNMVSGDNRIQSLKNASSAEVNRVIKTIESATRFELSVDERLKAFNLICRINEHASEVMKQQIDKYIKTSAEFNNDFLKQFQGVEDELYTGFYSQRDGHAFHFVQQAYQYYRAMYAYFYVPGYKNQYTLAAYNKLTSLNALPRFRIDGVPLNRDWNVLVSSIEDTTIVNAYNLRIESSHNIKGIQFYSFTVPANSELVLNRSFDIKVPFEYVIANAITPNINDTKFYLNGEMQDYMVNAIDTLIVSEISTTRYALILGEHKFKTGLNDVMLRFPNYDTAPMTLNLSFMTITDSIKIEAAIPIETIVINTDDSWQYADYSPGKIIRDWKKTQKSADFGLTKSQWYEMEETQAEPIWVTQSDRKDSLSVVFQKEVNIEGVFKEGYIKFIVPDYATVRINEKEFASEYQFNYDPESDLVFAGQLFLTSGDFKKGKNTIQIIVNNKSQWKGVVAELSLTVAHPELVR